MIRIAGSSPRSTTTPTSSTDRTSSCSSAVSSRDPEACHRSLVAAELAAEFGLPVVHLKP